MHVQSLFSKESTQYSASILWLRGSKLKPLDIQNVISVHRMIPKVLLTSCRWSRFVSSVAVTTAKRRSHLALPCTTLKCHVRTIHNLQLNSKRWSPKENHKIALSSPRFIGSSQDIDSKANPSADEGPKTHGRVAFASISRRRLEWQQAFRDAVSAKEVSEWQPSDWDRVSEELSLPNGPSWEVLCMHTLYQDRLLALGRNLMHYLEEKGGPLSHTTMTFYIGLLGETSSSSEQDDETKQYFDSLLAVSDVLDPASIEVLASGLSNTQYYKECVKLAEICKETSNLAPSVIMNILIASLKYKDSDLCASTLPIIVENIEPTQMAVFTPKIIEACLSVDNEEGLHVIMEFFKKHSILIPQRLVQEVIQAFHRFQPKRWDIQTSYIHHRSGRCVCCQHQMERTEITSEEFGAVQEAFLKQVIVGSNIFYKSSPEEVANFVEFVQQNGPFDVVVDGLNVLNKQRNPKQADVLDKTVRYFQDQGKRVLLLGSKVLTRYTYNLRKFRPRPAIYLTSTTKADDAFFLYAALQSGKDTLIVSKDKLRDHKFLMGPELRHLFQQWLKTVQVYDWFFSRQGEFTLGRRHLYNIGPDRDEGGWHLPINDIDKDYPFGNFQVLCVRDVMAPSYDASKLYRPGAPKKIDRTNSGGKRSVGHSNKGGQKNRKGSGSVNVNLDELTW